MDGSSDILSLLDSADPETLKLMLQALNAPETIGMGQQMMGAPAPEGRTVGHAYVASSPMEHAGALAQRLAGREQIGMGQQQRGAGIQAYINALRGKPKQYDPALGAMAGAQFANEYGSGD